MEEKQLNKEEELSDGIWTLLKNCFKADELLKQIKPLLKDFFIAKIRKKGDELVIDFPNGQRFILTVWEDKFHKAK
ncbi:MAG: hypothetical protein K2G44_06185 [Clostridia bacterium]|nr:hypothetical protein [Clostridia bacterium]MDE6676691.1 hypothetical protein [Clostridia bacterium]